MTSLGGYCEKYVALLEGGKAGGDSQAPQLELLHEIFQLLRTTPPDEVKAAQPGLEKALTASVVQGPASGSAPKLYRHGISLGATSSS